jgi:hypothetical protein
LRPWWHAESRPARFPTAHTTGGRATREVGNSTLPDPKCDLLHAAASEGRVGSPCPPHLVPAGSRRRRRGTFRAKQPASRKLHGGLATRRAGHSRAGCRAIGRPSPHRHGIFHHPRRPDPTRCRRRADHDAGHPAARQLAVPGPRRTDMGEGAVTVQLIPWPPPPWPIEIDVPRPPSVNRFMRKFGNKTPCVQAWAASRSSCGSAP